MNTQINDIEKEIRYLKSNLTTVDGTFKKRMQEEIQNLEFDMDFLKRDRFPKQIADRCVSHSLVN
jgi:hypothetical protein